MNRFDDSEGWVVTEPKEDKALKMADNPRLTAIWKAFDARATAHEGEFIEAVKRYAKTQKEKVQDAFKSKEMDVALETGKDIDREIDLALNSVFDKDADKALKSALAPAWLASMESGREHTLEMIGKKTVKAPDANFEVFNKLANAWVEKFGLKKAKEINGTSFENLRKNIQAQISEALELGETIREIRNRILESVDGVYADFGTDPNKAAIRANAIARTESATGENFGSYTQAKAEGMQRKQWLSAIDSRTRGADDDDEFDHVHANGETVNIDEPFTSTGESIMYPGDPEGSAGNVINCRCAMIYGGDGVELE